jgi:hypothetical protein
MSTPFTPAQEVRMRKIIRDEIMIAYVVWSVLPSDVAGGAQQMRRVMLDRDRTSALIDALLATIKEADADRFLSSPQQQG